MLPGVTPAETPAAPADPDAAVVVPAGAIDRAVPPESRSLPAGWLAVLSGVALGILLIGLGNPPVTRTQEARVVETAREMLAGPADSWVVPRLNGELRLKKPPLAYWASAASFAALGVNNFAGRLPGVLAAWATLAIVYVVGSRVFTPRAGLLAAAMLLGSHLFLRHARLAETDAWAMLFVTAATACFWRACDPTAFERDDGECGGRLDVSRERSERFGPATPAGPKRSLRSRLTGGVFWHLGTLACGFAGMSKGGPAAFPLVFLLLVAAVERRPVILWRFLKSGALLTGLLIPALWLLAVSRSPAFGQIGSEITNNLGGGGHAGHFWQYGPETLASTLPWTPLGLVVLWGAVTRWREDRRVRFALLWAASILGPLCLAGNKQVHYLVPLMPPLFVLTGWGVDEALSSRARPGARRAVVGVFWGTALATGVAAALIFVGSLVGTVVYASGIGAVPAIATVAAALPLGQSGVTVMLVLLVIAASAAAVVGGGRGQVSTSVVCYAIGVAVALSFLGGVWSPSRSQEDPPAVARDLVARFGDGPYRFAGDVDESLVWAMRRVVPVWTAADGAGVVLLARPDEAVPPGFDVAATVGRGKGEWRACRADTASTPVP